MKSREKNIPRQYISGTPQVFTVSLSRLLAIIAGAIITSVVGTAFAVSRTSISDHFLLVSVSADVDGLKANTVKQDVYNADIEYIKLSLQEIKSEVKELRKNGTLSTR